MPVQRTAPYMAGDTAVLAPEDPRVQWCEVTAPSGREFKMRTYQGRIEVWLLQTGIWAYEWTDTDKGTLEVVAAAPTEPALPRQPTLQQPTRWRGARGA